MGMNCSKNEIKSYIKNMYDYKILAVKLQKILSREENLFDEDLVNYIKQYYIIDISKEVKKDLFTNEEICYVNVTLNIK
jgi:hypothetical protein